MTIATSFSRRSSPRARFSISALSVARSATTEPIPPSVLVSELLNAAGALVTEHPLQPVSVRDISPAPTDSSVIRRRTVSRAELRSRTKNAPPPFIAARIGEPEAEWQRLDNAKLRSFFGNPSKFLIRERLGPRLPRRDSLLEEAEPLEPGGLAKYKLEQDLLDRALAGEEFEAWFPVARAGGELPPGRAGESHLRELSENARLAAAVMTNAGQQRGEPEQLQLSIGQFELSARIDNLFDDRLVRRRLTTRKPADLLGAWIDHLLMNCVRSTESILITATKEKQPVIERSRRWERDAQTLLALLLDFYWRGLREPLPFFLAARSPSRKGNSIRLEVLPRSRRRKKPGAIRRSRERAISGWDPSGKTTISIWPSATCPIRSGRNSRDRDGDFRAGPQGHDEGDMNDFSLLQTEIGSGPLLIEASAGTGKTFTIAGLVLRLLLERPGPDDR